ncbi:aminotransferase class IV [Roseibacillus persicicus]|uniref:branched-chain-amino-acid transaminase n=1 Tax=Roseibacillus persicicus TaxID=454148 RepID=A0A918WLY7_9BACT|nr:aminotransferase class IV [Roseibacillus persicicus]GHC55327.1 4-amino-4-deoxychorismate lyase [Roseibacillus persicicus]
MMVWLNGEWKEEGAACLATDDGAFLRGEGVFETMLSRGGKVFELKKHWARLGEGCGRFGLGLMGEGEAETICEELLRRNSFTSSEERVRVRVTRSADHLLFTAANGGKRDGGLRLMVSPYRRNEHSALAGIKAISYAENSLALAEGRRAGADEVLFANSQGEWCEGAWSNIFAVEKGRVLTPPLSSGCLPGVTRELVIGLARAQGREVVEVPLAIERVGEADELFLTSSLLGIGAVQRFGEQILAAGEVTSALKEALAKYEKASLGC